MALMALLGALALFWFSTRQFSLLARTLIWLAGAALLAGSAALLIAQPNHFGFLRALGDAWEHRGDIEDSVLVQAFSRNAPSVGGFVPQLLDLFIFAGAGLGALALAAFTPGEGLERTVRPLIFTLWGFIAGGMTALAVVAIGFGGQVRARGYLGELTLEDLHDGDTFWIGEMPLRLWGADAPEMRQTCIGIEKCGERSRSALFNLVNGAIVRCEQKQRSSGQFTESFGRPLVQCSVRREGEEEFDLAEKLIRQGFAVPYEGDSHYGYDDAAAAAAGSGVMVGCSLRPDVWRRDRAARREFEDRSIILPDRPLMGACPQAPGSAPAR